MPLLSYVVLALNGTPSPSPSVKEPDPDTVSPGWWGFVSLVFLAIAVYFIWRGMNKQLKRVTFDENAPQTIARGPIDPTPTSSPAEPAAAAPEPDASTSGTLAEVVDPATTPDASREVEPTTD